EGGGGQGGDSNGTGIGGNTSGVRPTEQSGNPTPRPQHVGEVPKAKLTKLDEGPRTQIDVPKTPNDPVENATTVFGQIDEVSQQARADFGKQTQALAAAAAKAASKTGGRDGLSKGIGDGIGGGKDKGIGKKEGPGTGLGGKVGKATLQQRREM